MVVLVVKCLLEHVILSAISLSQSLANATTHGITTRYQGQFGFCSNSVQKLVREQRKIDTNCIGRGFVLDFLAMTMVYYSTLAIGPAL